jgi:hypothetical protein
LNDGTSSKNSCIGRYGIERRRLAENNAREEEEKAHVMNGVVKDDFEAENR